MGRDGGTHNLKHSWLLAREGCLDAPKDLSKTFHVDELVVLLVRGSSDLLEFMNTAVNGCPGVA